MSKLIFGLDDIKPQLSEAQIKTIEHTIFMAKETEQMQRVTSSSGLDLVIFPSGLMSKYIKSNYFKKKKCCKECGRE